VTIACAANGISTERLAKYPVSCGPEPTPATSSPSDSPVRDYHFTAMATNYLETIGMLVGIRLGWSVLPPHDSSAVGSLDVDCELLGRDLGAVTNQHAPSNPARLF
jgi:hypothetical protein